jgi:subtilisin family serine protease
MLSRRLVRGSCAVLLFLPLLLRPGPVHASAEIGATLARRWATASVDEFIPVLVELKDRVDLDRELPQLAYGPTRLATRHGLVVDALQRRAEASQAELRLALDAAQSQSRARHVRPFWIDNWVGLEATPALLAELADRVDVGRLVLLPEVEIPRPVSGSLAAAPGGREPGLDSIGAPAMWAAGYTGRGLLVSGIDTGVRGTHVSLADRWRGSRVMREYAWFDPRGSTVFPADIGEDPPSHGTHTMGTMVGADPVTGDTIGVAPGAEWIAAFGIGSTQLNTLDLIAALEWTADPDGNPHTHADVPDVLNCSWRFVPLGIIYPCNDIMDGVISNLEAAGIVVVWSAGNEGSTPGTVGYPANSVNAFSTNFAVGNFDINTGSIYVSSSRGPTPCAGDSIKPEVVAPGVSVRSAIKDSDNAYAAFSGTSMAAPHVAGAAALLRQTAPQATPAQIKQALFVSAIDKGTAGEDNTYGMGLINIPAAADSLSSLMGGPDLRVESEALVATSGGLADSLTAGDTVSLTYRLVNRALAAATNTYLKLSSTDPLVTVVDDSILIGIVAGEDTATAPAPLRFVVAPTTPDGQPLRLTLTIGATSFASSVSLTFYTHPAPRPGLFTHDNTRVTLTVSNYGQYGLGTDSYYPVGGQGFLFGPSTTDHLAEGALIVGTSATHVSDAARRAGGAGPGFQITDHDFGVSPGGALRQVANIGGALQTTYSVFDDSATAEHPLGVRITQRSLIFPPGDDEGYVLLIYTLENTSVLPLFGLRVGVIHDWDFPQFLAGADTTGYSAVDRIGYMFDRNRVVTGPYRGVAVLSDPGVTAYRAIDPDGILYDLSTFETLLTDSTKWDYLSGGVGPATVPSGFFGDAASFIGTGPFDLIFPGDTVQVAFALVGSESGLSDLLQNAQAAKSRYDSLGQPVSCVIEITGDVNESGAINAADIIYLVGYTFKSGPNPQPCPAAGDVNCDGVVNAQDILSLVIHVFKSGPPPCDVCTLIPGTWACP